MSSSNELSYIPKDEGQLLILFSYAPLTLKARRHYVIPPTWNDWSFANRLVNGKHQAVLDYGSSITDSVLKLFCTASGCFGGMNRPHGCL